MREQFENVFYAGFRLFQVSRKVNFHFICKNSIFYVLHGLQLLNKDVLLKKSHFNKNIDDP